MRRATWAMAAGLALAAGMAGAEGAAGAGVADALLAEARAACVAYRDGTFSPGNAVFSIDLDGDGDPDSVIDERAFSCSSAASMYCGTGGCMLHAIIDARVWSFQAEGWRMIDWDGRPILLVARDGGWCGGVGAQVCFEAVVWSGGEMLSVMPPR